ncbi:MAG: hypothetical protein EOP04_12935, partial [Proteobacteria bacterium]
LKEIFSELELGLQVFVHRKTFEVVSVPPPEALEMTDPDLWKAELSKIRRNKKDFMLFEQMPAEDAYRAMELFADTVTDLKLRSRLQAALQESKPFRNFRAIINQSGLDRERWQTHWQLTNVEWVVRQWKALLQ